MSEQVSPSPIEQRGSYTVVGREELLNQYGMVVNRDSVIRPDGSEGNYNWIDFPREAVLVFPMDKKNIYLADDFTYATNQRSLEAAGGTPNEGENTKDAAMRIVRRELGVEVEQDSIQSLGSYQEITSRVNNKTHSFVAKVKNVGESNLDSGEDIRLKMVAFKEVMRMVNSGEINNAVVAASLWRLNELIEASKPKNKIIQKIKHLVSKVRRNNSV